MARQQRAAIRRAYACPCAGETFCEDPGPRAEAVRGDLIAIEKLTGHRPRTCPFHAFYESDVGEVLNAHDYYEKGQAREWWGDDPELWLVRAVRQYDQILAVCREDARERNKPGGGGLPPPKLLPGSTVQHVSRG